VVTHNLVKGGGREGKRVCGMQKRMEYPADDGRAMGGANVLWGEKEVRGGEVTGPKKGGAKR